MVLVLAQLIQLKKEILINFTYCKPSCVWGPNPGACNFKAGRKDWEGLGAQDLGFGKTQTKKGIFDQLYMWKSSRWKPRPEDSGFRAGRERSEGPKAKT